MFIFIALILSIQATTSFNSSSLYENPFPEDECLSALHYANLVYLSEPFPLKYFKSSHDPLILSRLLDIQREISALEVCITDFPSIGAFEIYAQKQTVQRLRMEISEL